MKLSVYHTPELTPSEFLPDTAVVIDVLRATTTIATALDVGAEAVAAYRSIDNLMQDSQDWPETLRLRAGERGGSKVEGCDLGNSPLEFSPEQMKNKRLFISTTNGTRAIESVTKASTVLTSAFINRKATVDYLLEKDPHQSVWLVGSGWEGGYSLEDTALAGALAKLLLENTKVPITIENDEVIAAVALYSQWEDRLLDLFYQASHGKRLLGLGCQKDLEYCSSLDIIDTLPIQKEKGVFVKLDV